MQKLSRDQAAVIGAYTGILCGPFSDLQAYAEKVMGRPVWTHEMPGIADELKDRARNDFVAMPAE